MSTARVPATCAQLLADMVRFDTVNTFLSGKPHPERPLAEHLEQVAAAMGLRTQRLAIDADNFNLLVTHAVSPRLPWLLMESHLDTVAVDGMTVAPFEAVVRDGRMYGRGACDTKSSGAAMLWALHRYRAAAQQPANVAVLYVTDEEKAKTGATAFVRQQLPALDWRPSGVIVGEPTLCSPIIAHNGVVRWVIRTHGVAAHSSTPSRGRSAIRMMAKVVLALEDRYAAQLTAEHPLTGRAQCSVNVIRGGSAVNIIPDRCEVEVDRRLVPGERAHDVLPAVARVLDELRAQEPELRYEQLPPFLDTPLDPAPSAAFIAALGAVMRDAGFDFQPQGAPYGTDASTLAEGGMAAVVLGPGDLAQAHTCDEWISLAELDRGAELYFNLMARRWPL